VARQGHGRLAIAPAIAFARHCTSHCARVKALAHQVEEDREGQAGIPQDLFGPQVSVAFVVIVLTFETIYAGVRYHYDQPSAECVQR